MIWWLILCVDLTGHGVPRLKILSGYVCENASQWD